MTPPYCFERGDCRYVKLLLRHLPNPTLVVELLPGTSPSTRRLSSKSLHPSEIPQLIGPEINSLRLWFSRVTNVNPFELI